MITFHVGQKVVCVRDDWAASRCGYLPPQRPRLGCEYVVRSISPQSMGPSIGLRFHWLVNPIRRFLDGIAEPAFCAFGHDGLPNFRPVIEQKTDISIFTAMLTPSNAPKKLEPIG